MADHLLKAGLNYVGSAILILGGIVLKTLTHPFVLGLIIGTIVAVLVIRLVLKKENSLKESEQHRTDQMS